MEIQKVFSDMYDEERIYSVLLTEDEMALYQAMFSDEAEGALEGAGAAGLAGAGLAGLGYGAKKGLDAIANKGLKKRLAARDAAVEEAVSKTKGVKKVRAAAEKAKKGYEKVRVAGGSEASAEAWERNLAANEEKRALEATARKAARGKIKVEKAKGMERLARKVNLAAEKALRAVKNNKKVAAGVAAGTVAAGAGLGAYAKHNKNNK